MGLLSRWRRVCRAHGAEKVYDHDFDSYRCKYCGHRLRTHGKEPVATRMMPVRRWIPELAGRRWARRTRAGSTRLSSR